MKQQNQITKLPEALSLINDLFKSKKDEMQKIMSEKYDDVASVIDTASKEAGKSVRSNPWLYIGAAGALFFIVGFLMGRGKE